MPGTPASQLLDWRECRRLRAWELHEQGWPQRKIAAALGVTQGAVSQWLRRVREGGGVEALHRKRARGRRAALTAEQLARIPDLIAQGPEAFGFRGNRWTTVRVAAVIDEVFGVLYHPAHVSRLLQKHCPNWRAREKG